MSIVDPEEADFIEQMLLTAPGATNKCGNGCFHVSCQHCDNLIRPDGRTKQDHPGTVLGVVSKRICRTCQKRDPSDDEISRCYWCGDWTTTGHCKTCRTTGYPRIR